MILYHGPSRIDGKPIVAIATGTERASKNSKTGPMVQVWILRADISPIAAIQTGEDVSICGTCKHRGTMGKRSCYVNVAKAPNNVWKSWMKGRYTVVTNLSEFARDRQIRIGAYGDPAAVPSDIWRTLTANAKSWTGYTHYWKLRPSLKSILMASVDSPSEYALATSSGWRTFRVTNSMQGLEKEIFCPASEEMGKRTTCAKCGLCDGNKLDGRKNIVILAHGSGKGAVTQ